MMFLSVLFILMSIGFAQNAQTGGTLSSPPGFATRSDYVKSFTNEADVVHAYQSGLISKSESMLAHLAVENLKQQDFYGKVTDQYGQPVAQAAVVGYLRSDTGFGLNDETVKIFKTQTDAEGLFQFTGVRGARFGQKVSKDGYEMESAGYISQNGPQTSPGDRAIFMMWKLRGAEPMICTECQSRIPYDGNSTAFDLASGKKSASGDLRIKLSRFPLKIRRGRDKYDWDVKVEMLSGGLLVENDPYPYWAPEKGYQNSFEAGMTSNAVPWSAELQKSFYFKNGRGQYGRLSVDLSTDSMHPETGIMIRSWVNPSGAQNLEIDPKKLTIIRN